MTHCGNGAAGTIWNRKTDKLIIDNKDLPSKQLTIIKPPIHSWSHGKPRVIAENIDVKGQARIQIAGEHDWMSFKTLFMHSNTYIELLNDTPKLVIHFTGDINLSSSSTFDLSNVVFAQLDSTNTTVRYGNIIYQRRLAVLGSKLSLQGNIQVPQIFNDTQKQQSQLLLTCEYLQIEMNV